MVTYVLLASCSACSTPIAHLQPQSDFDPPEPVGNSVVGQSLVGESAVAFNPVSRDPVGLDAPDFADTVPEREGIVQGAADQRSSVSRSEISRGKIRRTVVPTTAAYSAFEYQPTDVDRQFFEPSADLSQGLFGHSDVPQVADSETASWSPANLRPKISNPAAWLKTRTTAAATRSTFFDNRWDRMTGTVCHDYGNYYSKENMKLMGIGFGVGAILANTALDQRMQDRYQDNIRSNWTDSLSGSVKNWGQGEFVIAATGVALATAWVVPRTEVGGFAGEWGDRNVRAALVGVPPLVFMQFTTGASRPDEGEGSQWRPLDDDNGVSGHAFMGSMPFINCAMMTDDPLVKGMLYVCSTFTGLSRVNDNAHYMSQAMLGWWMSYLACRSVHETQEGDSGFQLIPLAHPEGTGIGAILFY
jgi:hypothetical protein